MRDRRVKPTERRHLSSQSVQGPQKVLTIHYETISAEAQQPPQQLSEQRIEIPHTHHVNTSESKNPIHAAVLAEARQLPQHLSQPPTEVLDTRQRSKPANTESLHAAIFVGERQMSQQSVQELMMIQDTQLANRSRDKEPLSTKVPAEAPAASTKSLVDWRKIPRIYIVLRTINCLDFLDTKRSQFVATQDLVMTKSMDLEKGEEGQHCFFWEHKSLPLEMKGVLGSGGFGRVDRVLSLISFQEYALKRVPRSAAFSGRKTEAIKQFIAKIKASKRIKHHHVVDFVGSYTDPKHMGLIMSPVADMDLSAYLATHGTSQAFIRTNPTGTDALIIELKGIGSPADNVALVWTQDMIMVQQQLRPTVTSLVASILSKSQEESGSEVFCEICCTSQQDDLSDFNELDIADM
ncbi:hypothetical protein J3E71DRAFT_362759 [Bipolaris maydis]|nr:hypothetical protein J3E71DRAFT_362759 [Bipolaris maydis]